VACTYALDVPVTHPWRGPPESRGVGNVRGSNSQTKIFGLGGDVAGDSSWICIM
jgi:hypothetical protein